MMHLVLVIAVVIILAASCLLTFALCRAATRRDMLEARWREESAGSVDGLCARCLKLVREQARPMCPKCGRCRCLEDGDMCGRCRAHRVLPSCSRCGAPRRKGSPDGLCGRCRQLLSGKART